MATRIEETITLADKFRQRQNDFLAIAEAFRHGDILVRNYNRFLTDIKAIIDSGDESTYTKQDFDDLLDMRNELFQPIMENMSFIKSFDRYNPQIPIIVPTIDPVTQVLGEKYYDEINNIYTFYVLEKVIILSEEKSKLKNLLLEKIKTVAELVTLLHFSTGVYPTDLSNQASQYYINKKQEIDNLTEENCILFSFGTELDNIIISLKQLL